jgi:hypothetical protein
LVYKSVSQQPRQDTNGTDDSDDTGPPRTRTDHAAVSEPIVESAKTVDDRVDNLRERPDSPPAGPADDDERVCVIITN